MDLNNKGNNFDTDSVQIFQETSVKIPIEPHNAITEEIKHKNSTTA